MLSLKQNKIPDLNFSSLTEQELIEFINLFETEPELSSSNLAQTAQQLFSASFHFTEVNGETQVIYFDKYLTEPIHDLILASTHDSNKSEPVMLESILALSEENLLNLARELKISDSLKLTHLSSDISVPELEIVRNRVVRILESLNLIIRSGPKAAVWEYEFPYGYDPSNEDKFLNKLINEQLCLKEELDLTEHTSDYIIKEAGIYTRNKYHELGCKWTVKVGDLITDVKTNRRYIVSERKRLEIVSNETFIKPEYGIPKFPVGYWNESVRYINYSNNIEEMINNLRGPCLSSGKEYKTFFQSEGHIFNLVLDVSSLPSAKSAILNGINFVEARQDGFLHCIIE